MFLSIRANSSLLESMINNLIVNVVRHNKPEGEIAVTVTADRLTVSNTSDETALDKIMLFNRFYHPSEKVTGNGLGLAIVKAVCDYHDWEILYAYRHGHHEFTVVFM